ncbi:phosphotransferase [uncultured Paraglaciecola sp.]|uniref:phosphotransferase n=1 Tax=uncultured Paraglaciecola sp. TaxID=1765024 RepID=UPI0030D9CF79|tara:strand:+ start:1059 stop:1898 length:840 start_codon:yes stop_codon:yes gene_type:complete
MPHRHQLKLAVLAELVGLEQCQQGLSLKMVQKGGAVNSSYILTTPTQCFFMKTFESDQVNQLNRKELFDVQKIIWQNGLACEPIYLSNAHSFQLDAWVESHTLASNALGEEQKYIQLANALSQIHRLELNGPLLDLPLQWANYLKRLPKSNFIKEHKLAQSLANIWYQAPKSDLVFCHNDLSLQHVTVQTPPIIFDWEYCAYSNRYFDIAACIEVNQLNGHQQESLLVQYAKLSNVALDILTEKVNDMLPLVNLTSHLWYCAADAVGNLQRSSADKISG